MTRNRMMIAAALAATMTAHAEPLQLSQLLDVRPQTIHPAQVDPVLACLNGRLQQTPTHPLLLWAGRVYADGTQPRWKRTAAARAILGEVVGKFACKPTFYLPGNPHVDPQGGGWGNSWGVGRRLRRGDCAASVGRGRHRYGEVIVLGATGESMIVVDTGSAVRRYGHIDVCRTRESEYRRDAARLTNRETPAWVVAVVGRGEAK